MEQGQRETARLRRNAEEQVERLMTQLSDLDSLREARSLCGRAPLLTVVPGLGCGGVC